MDESELLHVRQIDFRAGIPVTVEQALVKNAGNFLAVCGVVVALGRKVLDDLVRRAVGFVHIVRHNNPSN
ncbi:hypothetical protein D3C86_2177690 [compost metagenome]